MSPKAKSIRREGAYIVKSAETAPSRVPANGGVSRSSAPTADDKRLVDSLRRAKARRAS